MFIIMWQSYKFIKKYMATFSLNVSGIDQLKSKLGNLQLNAKQAEAQAVETAAIRLRDVVVHYSDEGHPEHPNIISGRLKGSIRYLMTSEDGNSVAYVGSDAVYAAAVEFGRDDVPSWHFRETGNVHSTKAYPFFRPAITDVFDGGEAMSLIENVIRGLIG